MLTAVQKAKQIDEWLSRVNQCMSQLPGDLSEVKMSLSGFDPDEMPEMAKHFGCRLYAPGVLDKFWFSIKHGKIDLIINSVEVKTTTTWTRKSPNQKAEAIQ